MLSFVEIAALVGPVGVPRHRLEGWCDRGYIVPAEGGGSQGVHRRFTLMQSVGILVAARVFASEQGCTPGFVGTVVAAFGAMTEADLMGQFAKGRTHLLTVCGGAPVLGSKQHPHQADVRQAHRDVIAAMLGKK